MIEEIKNILKIWKTVEEEQKNKLDNLCKKFNVVRKAVLFEEDYTKYKFKNGVEFDCPHSDNFEDYELTGDALKFAKKHYDIIRKTFDNIDIDMTILKFFETDQDTYYTVYEKDGKTYTVNHYPETKKDIEVVVNE